MRNAFKYQDQGLLDIALPPPVPTPHRNEERPNLVEDLRRRMRVAVFSGQAARCPCCRRSVALYARQISDKMAHALLAMGHLKSHDGIEWVQSTEHCASLGLSASNSNFSLLAWWDLVEVRNPKRADHLLLPIPSTLLHRLSAEPSGKIKGAGLYRITPLGESFVRGEARVAKAVYTFCGTVIGRSGDIGFLREFAEDPSLEPAHARATVGIKDVTSFDWVETANPLRQYERPKKLKRAALIAPPASTAE